MKRKKTIPDGTWVVLRKKCRIGGVFSIGVITVDVGAQGQVIACTTEPNRRRYYSATSSGWPYYNVRIYLAPYVYLDLNLPHDELGVLVTDIATGQTSIIEWN